MFMAIVEYSHHEMDRASVQVRGRDQARQEVIPYLGRKVLAVFYPGDSTGQHKFGPLVVVPGFIVEGKYMVPKEGSVPVTTVEEIRDPTIDPELTDLIRKIFDNYPVPVEFL